MRDDRDLQLADYEAFRFGATEIQQREHARDLLQAFLADLFRRLYVTRTGLNRSRGPRPSSPLIIPRSQTQIR